MTTAEIIAEKRRDAGMTQQALADKLNVARSMIAQYERGSKAPSLAMAKAMADVFGCTVDAIAG